MKQINKKKFSSNLSLIYKIIYIALLGITAVIEEPRADLDIKHNIAKRDSFYL